MATGLVFRFELLCLSYLGAGVWLLVLMTGLCLLQLLQLIVVGMLVVVTF